FAERIGITSPIQPDVGLSLALGSLSVTPKELANAYDTFASGGLVGQPYLVRAIGGKPEPAAQLTQAIPPEVAHVPVSLLRCVIEQGPARPGVAGTLRRPAAGRRRAAHRPGQPPSRRPRPGYRHPRRSLPRRHRADDPGLRTRPGIERRQAPDGVEARGRALVGRRLSGCAGLRFRGTLLK